MTDVGSNAPYAGYEYSPTIGSNWLPTAPFDRRTGTFSFSGARIGELVSRRVILKQLRHLFLRFFGNIRPDDRTASGHSHFTAFPRTRGGGVQIIKVGFKLSELFVRKLLGELPVFFGICGNSLDLLCTALGFAGGKAVFGFCRNLWL